MCKLQIILLVLIAQQIFPQTYFSKLEKLSPALTESVHLIILSPISEDKLRCPSVDSSKMNFFNIYTKFDGVDLEKINILKIDTIGGELLYIDKNKDKNLTNDGRPLFFPNSMNQISFDIVSDENVNQRIKFLLERKPALVDSLNNLTIDSMGNLKPKLSQMYGMMKGIPNYKGLKGSFYFDNCFLISEGLIEVENVKIRIGLFDYNLNGLFNDSEDKILVDSNGDNRLDPNNSTEVYNINDIFKIDKNNYKLSYADKYGKFLKIVKTNEKATFNYINDLKAFKNRYTFAGKLDKSFWDLKLNTIDGNEISIKEYGGKYVLLSFWGEWCKPCIEELPLLSEMNDFYKKEKFQIIGLLKVNNIINAKKIIKLNKLNYPQVLLTTELEKLFKIDGYPTNILILPDKISVLRTLSVNRDFFSQQIK